MHYEQRQVETFRDKRDCAIDYWERIYENYKKGLATKDDLVIAMDVCNCTEKAYLNVQHKMRK